MMRSVFRAADDRWRSGWVVLGFAAMAGLTLGLLSTVLAIVGLQTAGHSLDDPRLVFSGLAVLLAAAVATAPMMVFGKAHAGLSPEGFPGKLSQGLLFGAAVCSVAVVGPALLGGATLEQSSTSLGDSAWGGLQQLLCLGPTAVGEELLVRGVPLRVLMRGTHQAVAVGLTGGVFGLLHLSNPNATAVAALNVALVGIWLGALAVRTGSLWPGVGAHLAWNWFEGFFWGQPVSGLAAGRAVFTSAVTPAGFFSGGSFGPEASGWTAVVLVAATVLTVFSGRQKKAFLQ